MNRRPRLIFFRPGLLGLGLALALISVLPGCDYGGSKVSHNDLTGTTSNSLSEQLQTATPGTTPAPEAPSVGQATPSEDASDAVDTEALNTVLLKNVVRLIESAATTPAGDNFRIAIDNLNQYFKKTEPARYRMDEESRAFLLPFLKDEGVKRLQTPRFEGRDGRHLEDCLLFRTIAARVAGSGDDLSQVRAVFRWVVEQVQLVPPGTLAPPGLPQARARPYDVLLRGMAVEQGSWSERGWLFMALCRQLGVDVGVLGYVPKGGKAGQYVDWICGAVIGEDVYLFDPRLGMEIPGPDGHGIATLEQAATIPDVLGRLDLPGQSLYGTTAADLSAGKLIVRIDSSPGYLSPRMKLLQESLAGRYRMTLYRNPAAERDNFQQALGDRFGGVELWALPAIVDHGLFNDPQFVEATQYAIQLFDARLPLLSARLDQLRGEVAQAKEKYVKFRFNDELTLDNKEKTPVPREVRHALDMYATYFLATSQLDQALNDQAEFLFRQTLQLMPEYKGDGAYFYMFRWGALANLGRLADARGDTRAAIGYYCETYPTPQYHAHLLRARDLVWNDPMAPAPAPLAPAPRGPVRPGQPAATTQAASGPR